MNRHTVRWLFVLPCMAWLSASASNAWAAPGMLHASGNQLVDVYGNPVRLRGVNISSLESGTGDPADANNVDPNTLCKPGQTISDSVTQALSNWHANFIRLPFSQDRWWNAVGDGTAYRQQIDSIVAQVSAAGAYIELDLHSSDAGVWGPQYIGSHNMPDVNSATVLADVARHYANNPAVLFGLYNEPNAVSWDTWRNGGMVQEPNVPPYRTPGMQALLDAVRRAGAVNVVVVSGLEYSFDLTGVVNGFALLDNNILYDAHVFPWKGAVTDWDAKVTQLAARYPVLIGEFGVSADGLASWDNESDYLTSLKSWLDTNQFNFAAWNFSAINGPSLLSDWCFTPSSDYGAVVQSWYSP